MAKIALGTRREATQPDCIQALVVEFITTFLFVFAGVASAMTAGIYVYSLNALFILHTSINFCILHFDVYSCVINMIHALLSHHNYSKLPIYVP